MCRRQTRVLQPAAKPRLCQATQPTKEPFMRGDDVNSAISRGKEKRAKRRLLPPAVASRGPSQMVLLTLSAEPTEKVGKEPPTSAAAGARLDPAWHPSLAGCHEETRPLGCCWGSPAASDISGWEGTTLQLPQTPAQPWGVPARSNADLGEWHPCSNHRAAAGYARTKPLPPPALLSNTIESQAHRVPHVAGG